MRFAEDTVASVLREVANRARCRAVYDSCVQLAPIARTDLKVDAETNVSIQSLAIMVEDGAHVRRVYKDPSFKRLMSAEAQMVYSGVLDIADDLKRACDHIIDISKHMPEPDLYTAVIDAAYMYSDWVKETLNQNLEEDYKPTYLNSPKYILVNMNVVSIPEMAKVLSMKKKRYSLFASETEMSIVDKVMVKLLRA